MLIVTAIHPRHSDLNLFELERRAELGERRAMKDLAREKLLCDVNSLKHITLSVLQVIVFVLAELTFGMVAGIIVALLIAISYGAVSNLGFLRKISQKIYGRAEDYVLRFVQKFPIIFRLLRYSPTGWRTYNLHIDSREELQHLVSESEGVLTSDEKKLIVNSLSFDDRRVDSVMTPRDLIKSVKKSEFLGPLALNDLHQLGHSRLPVVGRDLNHIVGILHINNLLSLDVKRSTTAEKAMESKVCYIREDQTLDHALAAFLRTRHLLFIVVNKSRETVGLLTLTDVMEALLGRKIVDEFDLHDNLQTVSSRDLRAKKGTTKHENN